MKKIVVFGAGKSSRVLIDYLSGQLEENGWFLTVADFREASAKEAVGELPNTRAIGINVSNKEGRDALISESDLVISLLPPDYHKLVAQSCLNFSKNLLTASYLDDSIKSMQNEIESKGLLFIGELGLDPGIDHMSAMRLINDIKAEGGKIHSFYSHCGGLVSPESDSNPWHYKISWNPRNVVNAGKSGAIYLKDGKIIKEDYSQLFDSSRKLMVRNEMEFSWYPNRNSIPYIDLYQLKGIKNFIRTTIRQPEFIFGWKNLVDLKLTSDSLIYETDGMSLREFFNLHLTQNDFSDWLNKNLTSKMQKTHDLLDELSDIIETEKEKPNDDKLKDIMIVDDEGELKDMTIDEIKMNAAKVAASNMFEAKVVLHQLMWLGMADSETIINRGLCTASEVLLFVLEEKLKMEPQDKDMVVMLHQLEFEQDGIQMAVDSSLVVYGEDNKRTAMAKTVGLPLAITASLILKGKLNLTGLHIPVIPEIYNPVLKELENNNIVFEEKIKTIAGNISNQ